MSHRDIETRFANAMERDRFDTLIQNSALHRWFRVGITHGDEKAVPFIMASAWGLTEEEISATIKNAVRQVCKEQGSASPGKRMSPEELFCWRIGFEAVAFGARDMFLTQLSGFQPVGQHA